MTSDEKDINALAISADAERFQANHSKTIVQISSPPHLPPPAIGDLQSAAPRAQDEPDDGASTPAIKTEEIVPQNEADLYSGLQAALADDIAPSEPKDSIVVRDGTDPEQDMQTGREYAGLVDTVLQAMQNGAEAYDVMSALRMLEGESARATASTRLPRIGNSRRLAQDIVRFGQQPTTAFQSSTIVEAKQDQQDKTLLLLVYFLGLLGPQGALPSTITEEAIARQKQGDGSLVAFLDLFNNRFIQLFYRAWADARPIAQHDRPDDDRFLTYLGSAIGLGSPAYRRLDSLDDRLKLHYAGLMSPKVKSAARLQALISDIFGVRVEIEQCVGTWLHLDVDDRLSLGGGPAGKGGRLGLDTLVGATVYSVSDKIRIRIFAKDLDEYEDFLPPTKQRPNPRTEKLFDLVDFYLGPEIEYDIELALPRNCASGIRMDKSRPGRLGHIGWLKSLVARQDDAADESEDFIADTRFRPIRKHTTVYQS